MPACVKLRLCSRKKYSPPFRIWAESISFLIRRLRRMQFEFDITFKNCDNYVREISTLHFVPLKCLSQGSAVAADVWLIYFKTVSWIWIRSFSLLNFRGAFLYMLWLLSSISLTVCSLDELSNKVNLIEGQQQY